MFCTVCVVVVVVSDSAEAGPGRRAPVEARAQPHRHLPAHAAVLGAQPARQAKLRGAERLPLRGQYQFIAQITKCTSVVQFCSDGLRKS